MNKITYTVVLISVLSMMPYMANAIDKSIFNEYADLLQPDTVGMSKAQIKEQFNQPTKLQEGSLGEVWRYDGLLDPAHPENEHNNSCQVYFKQDSVHHVECTKN
ncbi:MAG: hypothetical protein ISR72_14015 [Methylobacter sp.]|nr:hypothetical protein [Methylobacter sp.]